MTIFAAGSLSLRSGRRWLSPETPTATPDALEVAEQFGGPSRTRTLDPLITSANQRVQADHSDAPKLQQLELD